MLLQPTRDVLADVDLENKSPDAGIARFVHIGHSCVQLAVGIFPQANRCVVVGVNLEEKFGMSHCGCVRIGHSNVQQ